MLNTAINYSSQNTFCVAGLTYKCDPHWECSAVNAEVLQDVISHETQDGETWPITCMVDLQEYSIQEVY